jgi:hypothetical protein
MHQAQVCLYQLPWLQRTMGTYQTASHSSALVYACNKAEWSVCDAQAQCINNIAKPSKRKLDAE